MAPAIAKRHVVAVMIDDLYAARPQSGLSAASVVYQAPAEGGIPRYMALFSEGNPPAVGPIRSSRLYYIAWAAEWNSVYAHVGGSPQALALLNSAQGRGKVVWNADEIRMGDKNMWRIKTRQPPHNVYSDAKHLRALVTATGAPQSVNYKTHWQFAPDASIDQRPVGGSIVVPYLANKISYAYNRATNTYLRTVSVEGKQVDAGTKQRIAPKNVAVMFMSFAPLNDGSQKHRLEAKFTGSGKAMLFTNGTLTKGTWKKASMTAPTYFYDAKRPADELHRRPDVRPGRADRDRRDVQAGQGPHAGRLAVPERLALAEPVAGRDGRRRPVRGLARATHPSRHSIGAGRAASAHTARVSRATSPHVRAAAGRSAAAARRPAWRVSSDHAARSATARRRGSPGSTRMPAGPMISGRDPTALATTGTPAASASMAAVPVASERTGWTRSRAPATSAASRSSGSPCA